MKNKLFFLIITIFGLEITRCKSDTSGGEAPLDQYDKNDARDYNRNDNRSGRSRHNRSRGKDRRDHAVRNSLLGGAFGAGIGAAAGAGKGALIGGGAGLVGGYVLSKIL